MITEIRSIYWFQIIFIGAFYTLALALPIAEALKQLSVIVIILLGVHLIFEDELKIEENLVTYSAAGIIISTLISAFLAFNPSEALKGLIDIFRILLIFLIIKSIPLNIIQAIRFKKILFISMLLALIHGLYKLYFDPERTELLLHSIGQISQSSFYMLLIFSLALSSFLIRHNYLNKGFLLLIILSSLVGLFLMDNQAMIFMSLLIILLVFIFAIQSHAKNSQLLFILLIIIVTPIIILFGNDYRLEKLFWTLNQNDELLQVTILAWLDHNFFFGIGPENTQYINPQNYIETEYTRISHRNTYITYLVERGLCGLGLYLIFIFSVLAALIKKYIKTKDSLVIAAIMIWLANFIISGISTTFHNENGLLIALIWGMALNEHLNTSKEQVH